MLGYEMEEILKLRVQEVTHPDSQHITEKSRRELEAGAEHFINEKKYIRKDGSAFWASTTVSALRDGAGRLTGYVGQITDISGQRRGRLLVECQNESLQLLISGAPLLQVFLRVIAFIEAEAEGDAVASVLLVDPAGKCLRHGAAPSLPEDYNRAMDGIAIAADVGTCAAAAARREMVVTPDIAAAASWERHRHLPLQKGLKAAWSIPILSATGDVLGTLGTYFRRPRGPTASEVELAAVLAKTLAVAIERRRAEENLARAVTEVENQRRLYETVLSNTPDLMCVFDLGHRFIYANKALLELCGRTWDNTVGRSLAEVGLSTEDVELQSRQLHQVIASRQNVHQEVEVDGRQGRRRFDCIFAPVIGADGQVEAVAGTSRDVTENFRSAAAARFLAGIAEDVAPMTGECEIVAHVVGAVGRYVGAHRCFFVECYEAENLVRVGKNWIRDGADDLAGSYRLSDCGGAAWWHALLGGNFSVEDVEGSPLIGAGHAANYRARGVRAYAAQPSKGAGPWTVVLAMTEGHPRQWTNEELRVLGEVAARIWPVVERSRTEEALKIARDQAVAASRAKDSFLARLSHELRTPLNPALLRASEAAADEAMAPGIREDFRMIEGCIRLEVRLIDDLLDVTRIANDKLELRLTRQEVRALIARALAMVRIEMEEKRQVLECDFAAGPLWVNADEARTLQIFWNLLKNAVKFTPTGGRIRVSVQPSAARDDTVAIEVSDTGYGLTPEELVRIFEPFAQGEHRDVQGAHRFGGLGLGLAISRKIAEMHAGSISARSEGRHRGASFLVELPLGAAEAPGALEKGAAAVPNCRFAERFKRILLVEDHGPSRAALAQLLERRGVAVVQAASAAEALEKSGARVCDFVISDLGLPDGNGYDLMAKLRADFGCSGIALTGYGGEEDVVRSRNAGFLSHLTKPVRVGDLERALDRCAGMVAGRGSLG
jgi:PAS domain S-box-containing protein